MSTMKAVEDAWVNSVKEVRYHRTQKVTTRTPPDFKLTILRQTFYATAQQKQSCPSLANLQPLYGMRCLIRIWVPITLYIRGC